jgi:hypothetical protein
VQESSIHKDPLREKSSADLGISLLVFAGLFLFSLAFQIHSGAWRSDFGGHADEAAHVVTSLMVRDYLAGGFLEAPHPMRYAEDYYDRFPRVAIGHYPPGFYLFNSMGLLPFRTGGALLLLMNVLSAGAGLLVFLFGRRLLFHHAEAVTIAALYVALPQTRTYTSLIMADLLLVVLSLMASLALLKFLQSGRARDALFFGVWAAGAILTKGSGVGLALLPPLALLFAGKGGLLFSRALWLAPVPVILFALPWMLFTMGITSEGMQDSGISDWVKLTVPFYGQAMVREVGWAGLAVIAGAAVLSGFRGVFRRSAASDGEAVLWALLLCGLAIPLLVPSGLDNRYLMPVIPSILLLGSAGLRALGRFPMGKWQPLVIVLFAFIVLAESARPVLKLYTGASETIRLVIGLETAKEKSGDLLQLLVVSNAAGEGAIIAAAALEPDFPGLQVVRGSKFLASSDWMGRGYQVAFQTPAELTELLRDKGIRYVVIDEPGEDAPEHWVRVNEWVKTNTDFRLFWKGEVPSWRRTESRSFKVYGITE